MGIRTKSLFFGLFGGIVAFGVSALFDFLNNDEPDYTDYWILSFIMAVTSCFGMYYQLRKDKK
jgi:hypothetical protein